MDVRRIGADFFKFLETIHSLRIITRLDQRNCKGIGQARISGCLGFYRLQGLEHLWIILQIKEAETKGGPDTSVISATSQVALQRGDRLRMLASVEGSHPQI